MKPFTTLIVTGTPGSGKSVLAKKLSLLLNYTYFDVNLFIKNTHIYSSFDRQRRSYVVDEAKLARELSKVRERALKGGQNGIIFDSHLSHFLSSSKASLCIVAKCGLKELEKRLKGRGYSAQKVRENLDAEIFDTCFFEAKELGHNVVVFDTTSAKKSALKELVSKVRKSVRT